MSSGKIASEALLLAPAVSVSQTYIDTSALLKAYVNQAESHAFVAWMESEETPCISPLSIVEMRCAVARLARARLISTRRGAAVLADFEAERRAARYRELDWPGSAFESASELLERADPIPLRALDALHLAVARYFRCTAFATADRVQSEAARRLGFTVHPFFT